MHRCFNIVTTLFSFSLYIINTLTDQAIVKVKLILDELINLWLGYFKIRQKLKHCWLKGDLEE